MAGCLRQAASKQLKLQQCTALSQVCGHTGHAQAMRQCRAFGDRLLKRYVVATPDVLTQDLGPTDECIIMATDGLWDVVTNQEACNMIRDTKAGTPLRGWSLLLICDAVKPLHGDDMNLAQSAG